MSAVLKATKREGFKKSDTTALRNEGKLPAVVYGYKVDNTPISVSEIDLVKTIREVGRNGIIELDIEGKKQKVVLSDYQSDFLKDEIIHADFLAVNMAAEIDVNVTVNLVGEAEGAKEGGVVQTILHELSISAKPNDIPESFEVDVTELNIGDSYTVEDLRSKYSVTINHEDDETIVSVLAPRTEEELEEMEAEAGAGESGSEGAEESEEPAAESDENTEEEAEKA
ncbi:50S ribosomal protein L25/general stress protein Ctc [Jeotgalibacillus sp. R-1-5s-1]|uniref:50S ribosomal protein L25/general stress protein Ctc n=1 Tax=Jeotgalibacillus sp. R-1-5s-1 TaxID=2555897 RepID=UPI0010698A56|nr:50S ribosomal protein L25/general stress protein Ctc [Jeotgalibacillus sp. R-1-5s-1]TFE01921.1 50S ribosomal protein L25/general stress protein Ctc [Jeotgalibacillus sp. R-1-5s-1]